MKYQTILILLLLNFCATTWGGELAVDTEFDAGIGEVVQIDQEARSITIRIPKGSGWRVKHYFHVTGITPGETLTLRISNASHWKAPRSTYSLDNEHWSFVDSGSISADRKYCEITQVINHTEAWFAWFPPLTPEHVDHLFTWAADKNRYATSFELCKSKVLNRPVMALRVSEPTTTKGLWIQSQQHSMELGGGWQASGFVKWLLSEDKQAQALRKSTEVTIVPIMDMDNLVRGFGGKDAKPHDHNRDWIAAPIYAEVKAAQSELRRLHALDRLNVFVDIHNQGWNSNYYGGEVSVLGGDDAFHRIFNSEQTIFTPSMRKVFRETNGSQKLTTSSSSWVGQLSEEILAVTIESNVASPQGCELAPPLYHEQVGAELGRSVERYLRATSKQ